MPPTFIPPLEAFNPQHSEADFPCPPGAQALSQRLAEFVEDLVGSVIWGLRFRV